MTIDTRHLQKCIEALETAHERLRQIKADDILYEIFRAACVKEFELVLEQSGKLLKRRLRAWFASNLQADRLPFRDIFRQAAKFDLITADTCERWLDYRDNRNSTAHDYGEQFAESTLRLLPTFIADAKELLDVINETAAERETGGRPEAADAKESLDAVNEADDD